MDVERPGAAPWVPDGAGLELMRGAVQDCRGCELWKAATQAVFGDGDEHARLMLVGEHPATRRISRGSLSWVRPERCSRVLWRRRASRATASI
jgi:DNA polymerase